MDRLPIDAVLSDVASAYGRRGAVVVEASPGAGKTTRVPPALAGARRSVVVLEPRRLAARLAARRVADERGERVGETVGHQVRFDVVRSARTRILFMTEAVLTRRITTDPSLAGVDTVIVDEVHERHLHTDLALALVDRLRRTSRPDLGLVIMSATVDGARVAERYDAELVRCELALHPVVIEHQAQPSREPLAVEVAAAVRRLCREGLDGHVLVFLPGAREIRDATERCRAVAERYDLVVRPLHGRLTPDEQDRAVAPSARTKVILATNVAESSITIDGVAAVIDSGLARAPRWHANAHAPTLETQPISQASATQRAGRAGRTRPGRCLRLYTERDLARAPAFDVPEIERADLAELVLAAHMAGAQADELRWLSAPPTAALDSARRLLGELGAVDTGVTDLGRRMARLPVHPRFARALVAAEARGVGDIVAQIAAVASEGGGSLVNVWREVERLDRSRRAVRASRQLARMLQEGEPPEDVDAAVGAAVLTGFRDRVAKRVGDGDLALADGGRARLRERTAIGGDGFTVVLDAMAHDGAPPEVRLALPIRSDWILEALFDDVVDERTLSFNDALGRVEQIERMRFRALTLDESRRIAAPSEATAEILATAAWERGLGRGEVVGRLRARLAWVASQTAGVMPLEDAALRRHLFDMSLSTTSLADLSGAGLAQAIRGGLPPSARTALERVAPERVRMQNGIDLAVVYPLERPPYVESYMQDFFGLAEGPRLGNEPLVLHLWAPNRRAEQVTRDLAGFWREHYPALFKRLSRRYPKHHWPEHPARAKAVRLKSQL